MPSATTILPPLRARGRTLDTSPDALGTLRSSAEVLDDAEALRANMREDGYLFLPGGLDRDTILDARRIIVGRLADAGLLDPAHDPMEAVAAREKPAVYFMPDLARDNPPLMRALYDGPMISFFERFLGGEVRHFDYTWMRAVSPGGGTAPHCDVVYMGRGTKNLYTAWTPLGDIPLTIGGLMVLENSHRQTERLRAYWNQDVDSYCENGPERRKGADGQMHWEHWNGSGEAWDGSISHDPVVLREQMGGGRWLTADFRAGDVLIFSIATIHASLGQRLGPHPTFLGHALPARLGAGRRALGRRRADRPRARGQARPDLLRICYSVSV
jgi:hypothetical protein